MSEDEDTSRVDAPPLLYTKHSTFYVNFKTIVAARKREEELLVNHHHQHDHEDHHASNKNFNRDHHLALLQTEIKSQFHRLKIQAEKGTVASVKKETTIDSKAHQRKKTSPIKTRRHIYHNENVIHVCQKFEKELNALLLFGAWLIGFIVTFGVLFQCTLHFGA